MFPRDPAAAHTHPPTAPRTAASARRSTQRCRPAFRANLPSSNRSRIIPIVSVDDQSGGALGFSQAARGQVASTLRSQLIPGSSCHCSTEPPGWVRLYGLLLAFPHEDHRPVGVVLVEQPGARRRFLPALSFPTRSLRRRSFVSRCSSAPQASISACSSTLQARPSAARKHSSRMPASHLCAALEEVHEGTVGAIGQPLVLDPRNPGERTEVLAG
jgi:hypothetical protein